MEVERPQPHAFENRTSIDSCHLLRLPAEIRNNIFERALADESCRTVDIWPPYMSYNQEPPGLILVNNAWGESNFGGLTAAAKDMGLTLAGSEKFDDKDVDMTPQLGRLRDAGADSLILVGNAAPGAQVMKSLQRSAWSVPVVSHWGISGGRFPERRIAYLPQHCIGVAPTLQSRTSASFSPRVRRLIRASSRRAALRSGIGSASASVTGRRLAV